MEQERAIEEKATSNNIKMPNRIRLGAKTMQNNMVQFAKRSTCMLLLLLLIACGPTEDAIDEIYGVPYEPPRNNAVQQLSRVAIKQLAWIGHYSFSPDHSLLIIDGTIGRPNATPATVLVLSWPELGEIWHYEHVGEEHLTEHPYVYQWQLDNSGVWVIWTPAGQLMHLNLTNGLMTDSGVKHVGFVLSPDGKQLIGWGKTLPVGSIRTASGAYRPLRYDAIQTNYIFVYDVKGPNLELRRELSFPEGGVITGLYWSAEADQLWLVWEKACDWLSGAGQFSNRCERVLWKWSLATDTFTLHWPDVDTDHVFNESVHAFNRATQWMLTTDYNHNLVVLDLQRQCPILKLDNWGGGQPSWYDDTSFVQILSKKTTEVREVAIYRSIALVNGETISCLVK